MESGGGRNCMCNLYFPQLNVIVLIDTEEYITGREQGEATTEL